MPFLILDDAVAGPADGLDVHIAIRQFYGGLGVSGVGFGDPGVDHRIFAVLVIVVFIELLGVIGRVADDDEDGGLALALDAFQVWRAKREGCLASASSKCQPGQMPSKGL